MEFIEITLGLLLAVAAVAAIGKWIPLPLPVLLVAGGMLQLMEMRHADVIDDEVLRLLQTDLDLRETLIAGAIPNVD